MHIYIAPVFVTLYKLCSLPICDPLTHHCYFEKCHSGKITKKICMAF